MNIYSNGIVNGVERTFNENGAIKKEIIYKNGVKQQKEN